MNEEIEKVLFECCNELASEYQIKIIKKISFFLNKHHQQNQLPVQFARLIAMMIISFLENTKHHFLEYEDYIKFKQSFFKLFEEEIQILSNVMRKQNESKIAEKEETPQLH